MASPLTENQFNEIVKLLVERVELIFDDKGYVLFGRLKNQDVASPPDHKKAVIVDKILLYATLFDNLVDWDINEIDQVFREITARAASIATGKEYSASQIDTAGERGFLKARHELPAEDLEPQWLFAMFPNFIPFMHDFDMDTFPEDEIFDEVNYQMGEAAMFLNSVRDILNTDYAETVMSYHKSAEQGDMIAQFNLAVIYYNGKGVEQDYSEAIKWYRKAAEQGNIDAQFNLALMYENGKGAEQNFAEAAKWYHRSAAQGDIPSQYSLGSMYGEGRGVLQNHTEAVKWMRKAADQGYDSAQYNLAVKYDAGEGVQQDYAEAFKWFRLAAYQGHAKAQFNLAIMHAGGQGVPQSGAESYVWNSLAAASGDEIAISYRDMDAKKLSPAALGAAQKRAAELFEKIQQTK